MEVHGHEVADNEATGSWEGQGQTAHEKGKTDTTGKIKRGQKHKPVQKKILQLK